jgi:L-fucose isomerase-like protein
MKTPIRLGIVVVASPLEVGAGEAPLLGERLAASWHAFDEQLMLCAYGQPITDPELAAVAGRYFYDQRVDALCVVAASWFEDYLVLDLLEECDVPLIAWARPGMETGSLCGMQQLGFMLKALGRSYCVLYDDLGSQETLRRAHDLALAAATRRSLRKARLGFMGHRVEGMTETTAHELAMKKVLGPRIVGIDTAHFLARADAVPPQVAMERWAEVKAEVGTVCVPDDSGRESMQVYLTLKEMIQEQGLAAVAIGCYPHLMGKVCLAASLLGEQGVPVGCEGDINGALAMLLLTQLTGVPVHNTDMLDPVPAHNSLVLSHCGSGAFSLACGPEHITLGPVRLMNRGLCCLFTARPGPCTLVNLVPAMGGYRLGVLYGEAIETTMVFPGNPLEVRFGSDYRDVLAWITDQGLGHHWMATYGDLRPLLADFTSMVGCEMLSMA